MRYEGSEVKKNSKIILAGKKGKMVAGENGLKNGPIENGLIHWSCPQRQNSSKCYFWSFPILEYDFNFLFHNVVASGSFILDPQFVQNGKRKKIVPGFYMTSM